MRIRVLQRLSPPPNERPNTILVRRALLSLVYPWSQIGAVMLLGLPQSRSPTPYGGDVWATLETILKPCP